MTWTKEIPTEDGYYWNRRKGIIRLYHFSIDHERSLFREFNVLWARRCDGLFDRERPKRVKGEWFGPINPPKDTCTS